MIRAELERFLRIGGRLTILLLAIVFVLGTAGTSAAQTVDSWTISNMEFLASDGAVYVAAETYVSYTDALYYDACLDASFTANGNPIDSASGVCNTSVNWGTPVSGNTTYDFRTNHYVQAYYEVYTWVDELVGYQWVCYDPDYYYFYYYYYYFVDDYGWDYWDYYYWWLDTFWVEDPVYQWVYVDAGYGNWNTFPAGSYDSSITLPSVSISGFSPGGGLLGASGSLVVSGNFYGSGFGGPVWLSSSCLSVSLAGQSDYQVSLNYFIPTTAGLGGCTIYVGTPLGFAALLFVISAPPPPPDFAVSLSPSSQSVYYGGTINYTVSIVPANGFSGQVALSPASLPSGATAYFSAPAISPGQTSTMQIQTSASSGAQGTFTVTVSGSGGGLTHFGSAQLQITPPPVLQVFANGTQLAAGGVAHITVDPATGNQTMPTITARIVDASGAALSGPIYWFGGLSYSNSRGGDPYSYSLPTYGFRTQDASQSWDIVNEIRNTTVGNALVGGILTVSWSYGTLGNQATNFKIGGDNLSAVNVDLVRNYLKTAPTPWFIGNQGTQTSPPWFLLQLANWESSYQQFNPPTSSVSPYLPNWGYPHGYGIMQVDHGGSPPPSLAEMWDWKNNVQVGEAMLNTDGQGAYSIWAQRVAAWQNWNMNNATQVPVPGSVVEGPCVFDMAQDGTKPPNALPYSDAIWIKRYNGASPYDYIWWNDTVKGATPAWAWSQYNLQSPPFDYVYNVCVTKQ